MGKHPTVDGLSRRIINSIKKIDINQPIIDILKNIDVIYLNYFNQILNKQEDTEKKSVEYIDNSDVDFDTFANFMYEELYNDEENQSIENEINDIASSMLVEKYR